MKKFDYDKIDIFSTNCLFPLTAVPKLDKSPDTVFVNGGLSTEVSCSMDNSNPLPTFTWEYQNFKCANCRSDKNQWKPVPGNLIITPTNTPANHSGVQVEKHQPSTYYRCKADNILGEDTHVVKLVRLCDKVSKQFLRFRERLK